MIALPACDRGNVATRQSKAQITDEFISNTISQLEIIESLNSSYGNVSVIDEPIKIQPIDTHNLDILNSNAGSFEQFILKDSSISANDILSINEENMRMKDFKWSSKRDSFPVVSVTEADSVRAFNIRLSLPYFDSNQDRFFLKVVGKTGISISAYMIAVKKDKNKWVIYRRENL